VLFHAVEFLLLFVIGPALFAFTRHRIPAIPALWVLTAWCLLILLRDPSFDRVTLWNPAPFARYAPSILILFLVFAAIGAAMVLRFGAPGTFLNLPRTQPRIWALLVLLYPVLSVYPQGIVYRAFLFNRYRDLFPSTEATVLASAFAFAWVHIIFRNKLAVIMTSLGGILFALRFVQTRSLFVTGFEHSLYGLFLFTVGVGRSFHHGSVRSRGSKSTAQPSQP
jgi:membrane protease YdiL (CAAX protease family)